MSSWETQVPSPAPESRPSWWQLQVDLPVAVRPNMNTAYVLSLPLAASRARTSLVPACKPSMPRPSARNIPWRRNPFLHSPV